MKNLSLSEESKFLASLSDLIELADSFDQLNKLALIGDLLYSHTDPVYLTIYEKLERTARLLRGLPVISR